MERRRPRRPAPPRSLLPTATTCRPTVRRKAHGPSLPAPLAGEDTGAPERGRRGRRRSRTARVDLSTADPHRAPAPWSAGVLAGLPRTASPYPPRRRADRPCTPTPTVHPRLRRWPVRAPALHGADAVNVNRKCPLLRKRYGERERRIEAARDSVEPASGATLGCWQACSGSLVTPTTTSTGWSLPSPGRLGKEGNSAGGGRLLKAPVQGRERERSSDGDFEIGRVVHGETKPSGKAEHMPAVMVGVDRDR